MHIGTIKDHILPTLAASKQVPFIQPSLQISHLIYSGSGTLVVNPANDQYLELLGQFRHTRAIKAKVAMSQATAFSSLPILCVTLIPHQLNMAILLKWFPIPFLTTRCLARHPCYIYGADRSIWWLIQSSSWCFPFTSGEQTYKNAMNGKGECIAIWPEPSIIPLNPTSGLIYDPTVYCNSTSSGSSFTYVEQP